MPGLCTGQEIKREGIALFFFGNKKGFLRYSNMNIVNPNQSEHSLKVATRKYTGDLELTIRDDYSKETSTPEVVVTKSNSYRSLAFDYHFEEGKWYAITLRDSNEIPVYRGKVYATSQTELDVYSVLKNKYEHELGFDNKFMTL